MSKSHNANERLFPTFSAAQLAVAAAGMALSCATLAADAPAGSTGMAVAASDQVHCYGVNGCKGSSDCKTTENACKGQNTCAGHGFKVTDAKSCLNKGGVLGDLSGK